jgi:hypothetical protein
METIDSDSRLGAAIREMTQNQSADAPRVLRLAVRSGNVTAVYEIRLLSWCAGSTRLPTEH